MNDDQPGAGEAGPVLMDNERPTTYGHGLSIWSLPHNVLRGVPEEEPVPDDELDWAYLGGLTDGDGSITREHGRDGAYPYARIRWSQKRTANDMVPEVLLWIFQFLRREGVKLTLSNFSVARAGHNYARSELTITNAEDTRQVLLRLLPYLKVKREHAIAAVEVMDAAARLKELYGPKYRLGYARTCSREGCDGKHVAKGLCNRHYKQERRG